MSPLEHRSAIQRPVARDTHSACHSEVLELQALSNHAHHHNWTNLYTERTELSCSQPLVPLTLRDAMEAAGSPGLSQSRWISAGRWTMRSDAPCHGECHARTLRARQPIGDFRSKRGLRGV